MPGYLPSSLSWILLSTFNEQTTTPDSLIPWRDLEHPCDPDEQDVANLSWTPVVFLDWLIDDQPFPLEFWDIRNFKARLAVECLEFLRTRHKIQLSPFWCSSCLGKAAASIGRVIVMSPARDSGMPLPHVVIVWSQLTLSFLIFLQRRYTRSNGGHQCLRTSARRRDCIQFAPLHRQRDRDASSALPAPQYRSRVEDHRLRSLFQRGYPSQAGSWQV